MTFLNIKQSAFTILLLIFVSNVYANHQFGANHAKQGSKCGHPFDLVFHNQGSPHALMVQCNFNGEMLLCPGTLSKGGWMATGMVESKFGMVRVAVETSCTSPTQWQPVIIAFARGWPLLLEDKSIPL